MHVGDIPIFPFFKIRRIFDLLVKIFCNDSFPFAAPIRKDPAIAANDCENHLLVAEVKFHGSSLSMFAQPLTEEAIIYIHSKYDGGTVA